MRLVLYAAGAVAVAATFSPATLGGALAAAASALFEAVPFLLAGTLLQAVLRDDRLLSYAGCGCTRGPSARSIPAAVATALIFGVWVALARVLAATVAAGTIAHRTGRHACAPERTVLLGDLQGLLASALLAGCASQVTAYVDLRTLSPAVAAFTGAALGFAAAPCALGAVAIAGALHSRAPVAATSFLCIAGIVDVRALFGRTGTRICRDATAYVVLSAALAIVAARHGDALVRPGIAPLLALSAIATSICALRSLQKRSNGARFAPALMLTGALVTAPPPAYTATETTLSDIFAGERIVFTGRFIRHGSSSALVRYAITCCRADAAPVVVRLSIAPRQAAGRWIRASGSVENDGNDLRLRPSRLEAIAPPTDPFIYR